MGMTVVLGIVNAHQDPAYRYTEMSKMATAPMLLKITNIRVARGPNLVSGIEDGVTTPEIIAPPRNPRPTAEAPVSRETNPDCDIAVRPHQRLIKRNVNPSAECRLIFVAVLTPNK
jgi:hypothetical protein